MRVRMARIYSRLPEKVVWITKSMRELRSNPQSGACFKKSMDDPGLREMAVLKFDSHETQINAGLIEAGEEDEDDELIKKKQRLLSKGTS